MNARSHYDTKTNAVAAALVGLLAYGFADTLPGHLNGVLVGLLGAMATFAAASGAVFPARGTSPRHVEPTTHDDPQVDELIAQLRAEEGRNRGHHAAITNTLALMERRGRDWSHYWKNHEDVLVAERQLKDSDRAIKELRRALHTLGVRV